MRTRRVVCALFLALGARVASAQSITDWLNPLGQDSNGIHLYRMSVFSSYYSSGLPNNFSAVPTQANLSGDVGFGGSATLGWRRTGAVSNLSVIYTPTFDGQVHYSQFDSLNHALSISYQRTLGPKWRFNANATGDIENFANALVQPAVVAGVPTGAIDFDALLAAALSGQTNAIYDLAALLTGHPVIESPSRTLVFGERTASAMLSTGLSYQPTQRLTIRWGATGARAQNLSGTGITATGPETPNTPNTPLPYVLPQSTSVSSNLDLSYSLSPRTRIGADASASRVFSSIEDAYTTTYSVFANRNMGRRWFVSANGGAGFIMETRSLYSLPTGPQWVAGGSLGFKTYSHSFTASASRAVSDSYGLGASASIATTGTWVWNRPGRNWSLNTSVSEQRFQGGILQNTNSLQLMASWNRRLTWHTSLQAAYSFLEYAGVYTVGPIHQRVSAVRLAFVWAPTPMR